MEKNWLTLHKDVPKDTVHVKLLKNSSEREKQTNRQVGRGRGLRVLRASGNPETRSAGRGEAATRRGAGS